MSVETQNRYATMSSQAVDQFIRAVDESPELQTQVKDLDLTSAEGLIALAEQQGYTFTAEEFKQTVEEKMGELSEEELESVTGGGWGWWWSNALTAGQTFTSHFNPVG